MELAKFQSVNGPNRQNADAWLYKCLFWGYGCVQNRMEAEKIVSRTTEIWGPFDHYTVANPDPLNDIAVGNVCSLC